MKADPPATMHHVQVAIPVGGERAARWFYGELLGFSEIEKPLNLQSRGGAWFQTGNLSLHLGVDPDFCPATKAHIAFHVDHLASMRSRFEAAGLLVNEDEPLPGYERFYVDDPFGNRTEILKAIS